MPTGWQVIYDAYSLPVSREDHFMGRGYLKLT